METSVLTVKTGSSASVVDLTPDVADFVRGKGDGLVNVFVPHATAGVAIIEIGAGSDRDLLMSLDNLLPKDNRWTHEHGSPGHGRDHVMPAFVAPSISIPVEADMMKLGTWQSIVLVDLNIDNPERRVRMSFLTG
ncbi:MAG: secondary thiamine-phosphate synthase enzyme YjbQ [Acidimicrobiia bacterium]|nr:secondary thiamine-phosphate synthase enzyme YjbQ [Acidimicrobiia bacterium]NNL27191.1 YjbQ family protein [Acidimicrobiia bacterium]